MNHICPDTIPTCGPIYLYADAQISTDTITCETWPYAFPISIGPITTYLWANGATTNYIFASNMGYYYVTVTTIDGCFTSNDSVYLKLLSNSNLIPPQITDSIGPDSTRNNNHTQNPINFSLCFPDSVLLTGSGYGNYQFQWMSTPPDTLYPLGDSTLEVKTSGTYSFVVIDTSEPCPSRILTPVGISVGVPLDDSIIFALMCWEDPHRTDTVHLCANGFFIMNPFDSASNPNADSNHCVAYSTFYWSVSPNTITDRKSTRLNSSH